MVLEARKLEALKDKQYALRKAQMTPAQIEQTPVVRATLQLSTTLRFLQGGSKVY